ncbi:MAG: hypothetical protein CL613_03860 [Aquimarina sp.]|nr:hypothetical protein [Aquimarina sp.]
MQTELKTVFDQYVDQLTTAGAISPKVIKTSNEDDVIDELESLEAISLPEMVVEYLTLIDGYDDDLCDDLDVYEPEFAWNMYPIEVASIPTVYEDLAGCGGADNPDYWPVGFLPILEDGSGSYVVVNCIEDSPTYGAVYDMSEGVGCNRVSDTISDFLEGCRKELVEGLRVFEEPELSTVKDAKSYLVECRKIYGNTPYFSRIGSMDQQIVDWK